MAYLLLVLHVAGLTGYNLLLRKSLLQKVDRWALATIMQTGIAIPMLIALFVAPPNIHAYNLGDAALVLITAVLVMALHLTNVKALQYLEVGVYSVLYNLRILFTTFLGVMFLREDVLWLQILGGLFIFLAVLTIRQKGGKHVTLFGILWGITASLVISFLNLAEKSLINQVGYLQYAIPVMLLAAIFMWAILLLRKQTIPMTTFLTPRALSLMSLRAVSAYGATLALFLGATLSLYTYISSLSVIVTVILGMLLLGETDYKKQKLLAAALAFIGLTLILFANLH